MFLYVVGRALLNGSHDVVLLAGPLTAKIAIFNLQKLVLLILEKAGIYSTACVLSIIYASIHEALGPVKNGEGCLVLARLLQCMLKFVQRTAELLLVA